MKEAFCTSKAWLIFLVLSASFTVSAYATPTLEIGGTTFVSDPSGVVSYTGTVDGFVISVTGITKPAVGTASNPTLDQLTTTVTNTGNALGTLSILFSEIGFGPVSSTPEAAFSASLNSGSVTYQTFLDPTNTLFGTVIPLTSQTMTGMFGGASMSGPPISLNSFSLTEDLEITLGAGGQYSGTETLTFSPVPEQGTFGMVLLGLALVMGTKLLRRNGRGFSPSNISS